MLSMQDLLVILAIVLVLFGGKKLPEIASGMGKAIKGFKKELSSPDEIEITPEKDDAVKKDIEKQNVK
jgi:sec-independent protein translocase protein TatA